MRTKKNLVLKDFASLAAIIALFILAACVHDPDEVTTERSKILAPYDYCSKNPDTPICAEKPLEKEQ